MRDAAGGILGVVRRQSLSAAAARAHARDAYVAAKSATEDPRAVALASAAAVAAIAAWVVYATHKPATTDDINRALRIAYAPRRANRLVRRNVSSQKELGAYLLANDPFVPCYDLLRELHEPVDAGQNARASIAKLLAWLRVVDQHKPAGMGRNRVRSLLDWAQNTADFWPDPSFLGRLSAKAAKMIPNPDVPSDEAGGLIEKASSTISARVASPTIAQKNLLLYQRGFALFEGSNDDAISIVTSYNKRGVKVIELDTYFSEDSEPSPTGAFRRAVEDSIMKFTAFPPRDIAAIMQRDVTRTQQLKVATTFTVDETEPCVMAATRLPETIFDQLEKSTTITQLVEWAIAHVRTICTRQYDEEDHMLHVIHRLSDKVRKVCEGNATADTVDDMVYLALALRVLAYGAISQFGSRREHVLDLVFAPIVRVALRAAELAQATLPAPTRKTTPDRDLNLFHEPQNVADKEVVADYAQLCRLLYDERLLLYVPPGIEDDASEAASLWFRFGGTLEEQNVRGGWGFAGIYRASLPGKADQKPPPRAPYYLGSRSWGVVRALTTVSATRSMLAAFTPSLAEGGSVALGLYAGAWKSATLASYLAWKALATRRPHAMVETHRATAQHEYVREMLECTPFRALNVACAALTVQNSDHRVSRSSVMHMLDQSTGYVRVSLHPSSAYAGIDTAPPEIEPELFARERIMMHFSRGHFATAPAKPMSAMQPEARHATHRVVGTPAALTAYTLKQRQYDEAIYAGIAAGGDIKLAVSLAARQYRLDVPTEWIAERREAPPPLLRSSTSNMFFEPETAETGTVPLVPVTTTGEKRTAFVCGLKATVELGILGVRSAHFATRIVYTDAQKRAWAYILNQNSAVRLPARTLGPLEATCTILRVLSTLRLAHISVGVWASDRDLMVTVHAREGTLRLFPRKDGSVHEYVAALGDEEYVVTESFTVWSSLFFTPAANEPVHIHAKRNGVPHVICISLGLPPVGHHAHVLRLLPSDNGIAPDQSIDTDSVRRIAEGLLKTPCAPYVRALFDLLSATRFSGASDPTQTIPNRWNRSMRAASEAAEHRLTKAEGSGDEVQAYLADRDLQPFRDIVPGLPESKRFPAQKVDRTVDPDLNLACMCFEAATGKRVKASQFQTLLEARDSFASARASKILPVVMGAGKSSVIIPILALCEISKVRTVIVVAPSHLVAAMHLTLAVALTECTVAVSLVRDSVKLGTRETSVVCVLSGHKMQEYALDNQSKVYTEEFRTHTTMIFDEIDGLMDPLQCEFQRDAGEPQRHYCRNIGPESYYRAVVDLVLSHGTDPILADNGSVLPQNGALLARLAELIGIASDKLIRRDFGMEDEPRSTIVALPFTRGTRAEGMHFSDIDMCAILTARLFLDTQTPYDKNSLRYSETRQVDALVESGIKESEACAIVAMRAMRTHTEQQSIYFVDIALACARRVGFSGTVEIPCALPLESVDWKGVASATYGWADLQRDPAGNECVNDAKRSFLQVLQRQSERPILMPTATPDEAITKAAELVGKDVRCVIDACGIFAGMSAQDVVSKITSRVEGLTGVYMSEEGTLRGAGCAGDKCTYYFNLQSSRGVDLQIPTRIKGAVFALANDTTMTDLAQAAYRLRLLGESIGTEAIHTVQFVVIGGDARHETNENMLEAFAITERARAQRRKDAHKKQVEAFNGRVTQLNANRTADYSRTVTADDVLSGKSNTSPSATATATATALSESAKNPPAEVSSMWYYSTKSPLAFIATPLAVKKNRQAVNDDDKALKRFLRDPKALPLRPALDDWISSFTGTEKVPTNKLADELIGITSMGHFLEGHEKYNAPPLAAGQSVNLRYVQFLAQKGALFNPNLEPAMEGDEPREPPATTILYAMTGSAQSKELAKAIYTHGSQHGMEVRITNRLFLEHTRVDPRSCVVIAHGEKTDSKSQIRRQFVIATLADLLLRDVRALEDPDIYVQGPAGVTVRDTLMKPKEPGGGELEVFALYLLASVGAVLSEAEQQLVVTWDIKYEITNKLGLLWLAHKNRGNASTRPSDRNLLIAHHLSANTAWGETRRAYV
jgi:hypothetical protein